MKILAAQPYTTNNNLTQFAIVELSQDELRLLIPANCHDRVKLEPGMEINICDRYKHSVSVIDSIEQIKEIPQQLNALAVFIESTAKICEMSVPLKMNTTT